MRADIAKLANQKNRMTMHQTQQMQHVQQMSTYCELCGDGHTSDMCPTNPESIYYVGQQSRSPINQHALYGNTNWKNHPNFSWGGNIRRLRIIIGPKEILINLRSHPASRREYEWLVEEVVAWQSTTHDRFQKSWETNGAVSVKSKY